MKQTQLRRFKKMTISNLDSLNLEEIKGAADGWPCLTAVVMGACIEVTDCVQNTCTCQTPVYC